MTYEILLKEIFVRYALIKVTNYWAPRRGPTSNAWKRRWGAPPDKTWLHITQDQLSGGAPVDQGLTHLPQSTSGKSEKQRKANAEQSQKKQEKAKNKEKH